MKKKFRRNIKKVLWVDYGESSLTLLSVLVHVSQEQVKRYIQEQMGKPVFEYDIYNCPTELKGQLKIGDFS